MWDLVFVRSVSILGVFALVSFLKIEIYYNFFLAILFTHYILATVYAKKQTINLFSKGSLRPLLVVAGLSGLTIYFRDSIFIFFIGLHIALSEVYFHKTQQTAEQQSSHWSLIHSLRLIFTIAIYVIVLRNMKPFQAINYSVVIGVFALAIAGYTALILPKLKEAKTITMAILCYDLIALSACAILYFLAPSLSQKEFVLYHVLTWIALPSLLFIRKKSKPQLSRFAAANVLLIIVFSTLQYKGFISLESHVPFWGTLHFMLTFATSKLNPDWVVRIFSKAPLTQNMASSHS